MSPLPRLAHHRGSAVAALLVAGLLQGGCGSPGVPNLDSPGSTIVCLGDSITAGVGAGRGPGYPELLAERLGVEVINAGVPGDTAAEGLARLEAVLAQDPWLVIVELGGNDLLHRVPREQTEAALRTIVERLLAAGVAPMLIEIDIPFVGDMDPIFGRLRSAYGVPVVEDVLGDILLDPKLKSDQIHPNATGYQRLAEAVAEGVEPLLEIRRGLR